MNFFSLERDNQREAIWQKMKALDPTLTLVIDKKYGESGGEIIHSTPLSTLIFGLFPLSTPLSTLVYDFFPLATPLST